MSPGGFNPDGFAPAAFNNGREACAEDAIHSDDDGIAWLHQIDDRCFHAGRAGAGDRNGETIRRRKDLAQEGLDIVHHGEEGWVEVPKQRRRHGAEHP